jgi:uncharacterized membrane protein YgdD (TMEM256/DUF423 family)
MKTSTDPRALRKRVAVAGLLGLTGVALGAFGAHALRDRLAEAGMAGVWETAVLYQLVHAVALVAVTAAAGTGVVTHWRALWSARLWVAGVVLFSGSLYLLALDFGKFWGPITPIGGVALLLGWLLLVDFPHKPTKRG